MTKRFSGKVVYLTGGGSGVGRATAELFAAEGAKVYLVDVNDAGLKEVIAGIGDAADGEVCDVSSFAAVSQSVENAVRRFGGIDVLVNAAGIGRSARLEEIEPDEWHKVISVNLTGVFNTTKAAMPHLLARPGGAIVNVASIAGMRGQAYASHYCASKAGMINFTRSIALEYASRKLRANCICPSGIKSPLIRNFIPREDFEPSLVAYYSPPIPHQHWDPIDVAKKIAFLASDDAKMMNGAALVADGGTLA